MFKLNNKGYMLVEIILASVIAFGVAYVVINLTMKLKNKNDDLLVETQVKTDQAIITNKLMEYAIASGEDFDCSKLSVNDKQIIYDGNVIDIVNDNTIVTYDTNNGCINTAGKININIDLNVPQMNDKDYDVQVEYKYEIGDMENPICTLKIDNNKVVFDKKEDNPGGSGIGEFGIVKGTDETYNGNENIDISTDTFTGFVKDKAGNKDSCGIDIVSTKSTTKYICKKSFDSCPADSDTCPYSGNWVNEGGHCNCYSNCSTPTYEWACHDMTEFKITHTSENPNSIYCNLVNSYCGACPSGYYDYGSVSYCYKSRDYFGCSSGTRKSDGCYLENQTSCSSPYTQTGSTTTYSCNDSTYLKLNDNYCYKLMDN